ncbi:phosphodiesterase [Paraferrimonas sp. SM1919]|uniref:phosphodiesterase n=1 Tax=Paraferrimonas sp. SM1919 TaxID=2662263 RepID=UPI0013D8D3FF|nr:phosphodiesterase [Paraferrimonas sp. SM1919]
MKLLIASDLHGSATAAQKIINQFEYHRCEYLVLLGDLVNHGPRNPIPEGYDPLRLASILNPLSHHIIAVKGNCDSEVDQQLLDFDILAPYNHLLIGHRRLYLTHGHDIGPKKPPKLNNQDILCSGHSHIPVMEPLQNYWHFNPGSAALPRNGLPASAGIIDDHSCTLITLNKGQTLWQHTLN